MLWNMLNGTQEWAWHGFGTLSKDCGLLSSYLHTCFHLVAAEVVGTGASRMPINREGGGWTWNLEAGTAVMHPGLEQFYRDSKGFCCATVFMEDLSGIVGVWYILISLRQNGQLRKEDALCQELSKWNQMQLQETLGLACFQNLFFCGMKAAQTAVWNVIRGGRVFCFWQCVGRKCFYAGPCKVVWNAGFHKPGSFLGLEKADKEELFCHGLTTVCMWNVSAPITWLRTGYASLRLWSFHCPVRSSVSFNVICRPRKMGIRALHSAG